MLQQLLHAANSLHDALGFQRGLVTLNFVLNTLDGREVLDGLHMEF